MARTTAADEKNPQLKSLYAEVGAQIRRLRVSSGLTQEQLSDRSGVNRTYIAQIEKVGLNLTLGMLHQLAMGLGVRFQDILLHSEKEQSDAELRLRIMTNQVMETLGTIQSLAKKQADTLAVSKMDFSDPNGRSQADN